MGVMLLKNNVIGNLLNKDIKLMHTTFILNRRNFIRYELIILMMVMLSVCTKVYADVYYIDPVKGNDKNRGDISNPLKTLKAASKICKSGDTVYLRQGKYVDDYFKAFNKNTSSRPITIKAFKNEKPVIQSSGIYGAIIFVKDASWYIFDGLEFVDCSAQSGVYFVSESTNIVIRNTRIINTKGTPVKLRKTTDSVVEKSYFDTAGSPERAGEGDLMTLLGSSRNVIRNNYFTRGGHYAVVLMRYENIYSRFNKIQNNRIEQHWGGGIGLVLGSEFNLIEGNMISYVGEEVVGYPKVGIQLTASNNSVRNNTIYATARRDAGIYFGAYDYYGTIQNSENNVVYNNTLYQIGGEGLSFTQKAKASNSNNKIFNNVIYKASYGGPYPGGGVPRGNYDIWIDTYHAERNWDVFPNGNVFRNNWHQSTVDVAYVKKAGQQSGQWGRSISLVEKLFPDNFAGNLISDDDPQFLDESKNRFELRKNSPLIDKGIVVDDYNGKKGGWGNLSYCGKAPDIGAFEFCDK